MTENEIKTLELYKQGFLNCEIAKKLNISNSTVFYILKKLNNGKRNKYNHIEYALKKIENSNVVFTSFKEMRKYYSRKICIAYNKIHYLPDCPENYLEKTNDNILFVRKNNNRLWHRWKSMRYRCYNKNCSIYSYYGGAGVTVCDEWLIGNDKHDGFDCFALWAINNGYIDGLQKQLQLDRIDNSKGYSPENCRWVDPKTNLSNRKSCIRLILEDGELSIDEYCKLFNQTRSQVLYKIKKGDLKFRKLYK